MVYAVGNTSLFGQNMETYPGNENATGPKENPVNLGRCCSLTPPPLIYILYF